jgi:hypothetical protein
MQIGAQRRPDAPRRRWRPLRRARRDRRSVGAAALREATGRGWSCSAAAAGRGSSFAGRPDSLAHFLLWLRPLFAPRMDARPLQGCHPDPVSCSSGRVMPQTQAQPTLTTVSAHGPGRLSHVLLPARLPGCSSKGVVSQNRLLDYFPSMWIISNPGKSRSRLSVFFTCYRFKTSQFIQSIRVKTNKSEGVVFQGEKFSVVTADVASNVKRSF